MAINQRKGYAAMATKDKQEITPEDVASWPKGTEGAEVEIRQARFDDDEMRAVQSIDDAARMVAAEFGTDAIASIAEELGSGAEILEDKSKLIGERLLLIEWRFNMGDNGPFVSAAAVTTKGDKYIINDGSSGMFSQLDRYSTRTGKTYGLLVPKGLRASTFATCGDCHKPRRPEETPCPQCGSTSSERGSGTTFYLDTSA